MPDRNPMITAKERIALLLILLVGAALRFQHLGAIEYNIDQVYPIWQAIQTLDVGDLPLAGQGTSVLFANPPMTGYLYLPVLALYRDPVSAFVFTIALNTLAIWLVYRVLRSLIGRYPALIGTALFAVNPWVIEDSRRTWVQGLFPFFAVLIFWALAPVLTGQAAKPRRRLLIALVALAVFAHTYLLAFAQIAPVALLIVLFWRWRPGRIHLRPLLVGAGFLGLLLALYAAGLASEWDSTTSRANDFASGQARLSTEALKHATRLVTGWNYADVRGMTAPADDANLRNTLSDIAHGLWALCLILGGAQALRAAAGRGNPSPHDRDVALILLIWFVLPVLMLSYVSRMVHPFYMLLTVPAGHALAAWGVRPLLHRPALAATVAALVVATGAINGLNTVRFAQDSIAHPGADLPETLPLADAADLGHRLEAAGAPAFAAFIPLPEWTPITLVGRHFRTENTDTYGPAVLVPEEGGIYVQVYAPDAALDTLPEPPPYARMAGSPLVLADGAVIELWRVTPDDVQIDNPSAIPSDIDVSFAGWTLRHGQQLSDLTAGKSIALDTFWHIETLHPQRGVWSFLPVAIVFDSDGHRVAEAQGNVVSPLTWAAGDIWVQPLTLTIPDDAVGPFTIRLGLFDPVRVRDDGVQGINAIFRVPAAAPNGETLFTPEIMLE